MLASDTFEQLTESLLNFNKEALYTGYGGGFTYKTPLGPVSMFLAGNNKDSHLTWYINMGYTF
jgi:outer membrane translocation and assembly module TamA